MNEQKPQRVSSLAWMAMGAIVIVLALVAIFANWEKANRDKIESVSVSRFTPSPSPSPTSTP